jgi:hypothetical protein
MKITDKMRLDWANRNGEAFGQDYGGRWWSYGEDTDKSVLAPARFKTIRRAIDAAIRAGERNKI